MKSMRFVMTKQLVFGLSVMAAMAGFYGGDISAQRGAARSGARLTPSEPSVSTTFVISQFYPGGGSGAAGVTYKKDYIELKNISGGSLSVSGLTLQYGAAAANFGSGTNTIYTLTGTTVIPAGGYYLVELGTPGTAGADITPTPNESTTNLSMSATNGHVALTNTP